MHLSDAQPPIDPLAAPARTPRRPQRRWIASLVVLALVMLAGVLLIAGPVKGEPRWLAEGVADLTGANPHPIHLLKPKVAPLTFLALLGQKLFNDPKLSASGAQSCASCHSPQHGYGPPNALAVQIGGAGMDRSGFRPAPSLGYLYRQTSFSIGPDQGDQDAAPDLNQSAASAQGQAHVNKTAGAAPATPAMVPQGGLFWDGRADTLQSQALGPLLNPDEMANTDVAAVAKKLASAPYANDFKVLFGNNILNQPDLLVAEAMSALGRYQVEDASFHPFNSRYDRWLEGQARLSRSELRGLRLFNDPKRANCAGCHPSQAGLDGLPPLFTDTQYEALGVPRNQTIKQNQDATFFDMGICGPVREDLAKQTQYCGMFLTPTLRNSAERPVFFHNAIYTSLDQVLTFYNLRDTHPEKIYPVDGSGHVAQFNDLPEKYRDNIDHADAPFNRHAGDQNAMTDRDLADIKAFLGSLSDEPLS
jgi:cytochrome c peroxidase